LCADPQAQEQKREKQERARNASAATAATAATAAPISIPGKGPDGAPTRPGLTLGTGGGGGSAGGEGGGAGAAGGGEGGADGVSEGGDHMIGAYSPRSRRRRIERFLEKRQQRVWTKKTQYNVRKNFANSRMRVKGRFITKDDEAMLKELMALS
jgi:hypothetical protein